MRKPNSKRRKSTNLDMISPCFIHSPPRGGSCHEEEYSKCVSKIQVPQ